MKRRYWLLASAGMFVISEAAYALEISCAAPPTCAEMGFTKTAADCEGIDAVKCPFDLSKMYCPSVSSVTSNVVECQVGSILYDDKQCYDGTPSGRTAIGVVFDADKRLAIALSHKSSIAWGVSGTDISVMTNCTSANYDTCDVDGNMNTAKMMEIMSSSSSYAAGYCRIDVGSECFLPSVSELKTLYNNKTAVNNGLSSAGGTALLSGGGYLSSNEYSDTQALRVGFGTGAVYPVAKDYSFYSARCAIAY